MSNYANLLQGYSPEQASALAALELHNREIRNRNESKIEFYRNDPCAFAHDKFGIKIWSGVEEIFDAIKMKRQRICVVSANGIGKTEIESVLPIWWLYSYEEAICSTISSSAYSLRNILIPRIRVKMEMQREGICAGWGLTQDTIRADINRHGSFRSPKIPENVAGAHSPNLMQLIEESSGITKAIAEAVDGNHKGENAIQIWFGNPLWSSGPFYDNAKSRQFHTITLSALDHENVKSGKVMISGAVTRENVESDADRWCIKCAPNMVNAFHLPWKETNEGWYLPDYRFETRDLARFPTMSADTLYDHKKLDECFEFGRDNFASGLQSIPTDKPIGVGCDVARFGDDETSIAISDETGLLWLESKFGMDETEIADRLIAIKIKFPNATIAIDATGGYGAGVFDIVRRAGHHMLPVTFSHAAAKSKEYANLKAELYFNFREELKMRKLGMFDEIMIEEAKTIKFFHNAKSQLIIESKEDLKARGEKSPDRFEGFLLSRYALGRTSSLKPSHRDKSADEGYKAPTNAEKIEKLQKARVGRRYGSIWDE